MTRVKFVIFKNEILALFPDLKEQHDCIACYSLRNGHTIGSPDLMRRHRANLSEYTPMLNALVAKGYKDLKVINEKKLSLRKKKP